MTIGEKIVATYEGLTVAEAATGLVHDIDAAIAKARQEVMERCMWREREIVEMMMGGEE